MTFEEKVPFILDGATGTNLQLAGMPCGVCPEQWIIDNPQHISGLQRAYVNAGSNAVLAPTFGLNRIKLKEYGINPLKLDEMCNRLVSLSKEAVSGNALVGGDLSSTGLFLYPLGTTTFEELVDIFKQQVLSCLKAGVDFFMIETMMYLAEVRAALLAVKECCDLPVLVTMTFEDNGRTLMGTDALAALVTLQEMGIYAFGMNCSTGPDAMYNTIQRIIPHAKIPLIAKPNAGLPKTDGIRTYFDLSPNEFASSGKRFADLGVGLIGGCCGTTPLHIKALCDKIAPDVFSAATFSNELFAATEKDAFLLSNGFNLSPAITACDISTAAMDFEMQAFDMLVVNVSSQYDADLLLSNLYMIAKPICIQTGDASLLESVARQYSGRIATTFSSSCDIENIIKKYGVIKL